MTGRKTLYGPLRQVRLREDDDAITVRLAQESQETINAIVRYVYHIGISHMRADDLLQHAKKEG